VKAGRGIGHELYIGILRLLLFGFVLELLLLTSRPAVAEELGFVDGFVLGGGLGGSGRPGDVSHRVDGGGDAQGRQFLLDH
jgi:hypothetical protein